MKEIIKQICKDLDEDIGAFLLADSNQIDPSTKNHYENYQLLHDPIRTAFEWQKARNVKKWNAKPIIVPAL